MAVSLLYSAGARSTAEPVGERLLYQLSLDRAFARVCPDVPKRERFLAVVSALTDDAGEIAHRQEVLRDFQEKRAELVEKRLQRIPPHLLKSIDLYPLSKAC